MKLKKFNAVGLFALAMLALSFGAARSSGAVVTLNGDVTGMVGPGAPFSSGGGDQVTITLGSLVHVGSGTAIQFNTSSNALSNFGTISVGNGSTGIFFNSGNNNVATNSGTISVGNGSAGIEFVGNNNVATNSGTISVGNDSTGIFSGGDNNVATNSGTISVGNGSRGIFSGGDNNVATNSGTISGGDYNTGIRLFGNNNVATNSGTISVGNNSIGIDLGGSKDEGAIFSFSGNNNVATNSGTISVGNDSIGILFNVSILGFNDSDNNVATNSGTISVGNNSTGILFFGNNNVATNSGTISGVNCIGIEFSGNNNVATNSGTISGGNDSFGIVFNGNNNVATNWGAISVGIGGNAIFISGNNNVINLNGRSSVNGPIHATGAVDSNRLNLNFTGVSPAAAAALKGQLAAQGALDGHEHNFSFTLRGVNYVVDPMVVTLNTTSYQQQGVTPNQQAVGANLDSFTFNPSGEMLEMLNKIDVSGEARVALEALSPQPYQLYGDIATATMNFMTLEIDSRLNNLRDGSESIDTTGVGGNTDKTTMGLSKEGKGEVAREPKTKEKRWGFFASGSGLFANVDGHGGDLTDASFAASGVMVGVDAKVTENLVAGLLFNYNHTDADLDNAGSAAKVETFGGGLYAGYHNGGYYGNGLLNYSHNSYESSRNIIFTGFNRTATGSTSGNQFGANIDGGYDFKVNENLTVGPLAGLQYVRADVEGFNEFGAGPANLAVGSQSVDSLRSRVGLRADWHKQIASEAVFAAEARVAWQHEFLDDSRAISATFAGSGLAPFAVQTTNPERDAALLGVGINVTVRNTMTVFVDYDVQAGQASYLEHSIKGGLKFSF